MNVDTIDGVTEAFGLQKVSILRTFCVKTGVQVIWERLFTNVDTRNTVAPSYVESTVGIILNLKMGYQLILSNFGMFSCLLIMKLNDIFWRNDT
jgi:hypothetical protein